MRYQTANSDKLNVDFLKAKYQFQEPLDGLVKDLKGPKRLMKLDSSSSLSDSGRSEDDRLSSTSSNSKKQHVIERRHKNFQVKKKTELCKTYQLGHTCPYGSKCSFAHGFEELKCKVLVPGNYRTIKCKQFFEKDSCHFGPRCQFLHKSTTYTGLIMPTVNYEKLFEGVVNSLDKKISTNSETNEAISSFTKTENFGLRRLKVFENSTIYC
jgi:hypothetical protein